MRQRGWILGLGAIAVVGAAALSALAQGRSAAPILHEDLTPPAREAARTAERIAAGIPVFGPDPGARQNPTAIAAQEKILPAPASAPEPEDDEPVFGAGGFGADRATESRPDYSTGADDTLHYVGVFNPSILPFKRMSSLDSVRDDFTLFSGSPALADVPVGGGPREGHDLFWGSILVELSPGVDVPIPSVSPDMRILSYETEPAINVAFAKDGADNFYVRSDEPGASGRYRLVFLVEADPRYFAPELPERLRVRDIPAGRAVPLPPRVRASAARALRELGLSRNMLVQDALQRLTYYFRSFSPRSPPPASGDIYWDLFASQAGVCRHRSFAFMITANALGVPTRFLSNEAHAWVEVWLPEPGWMRVDLGGAASTLEVQSAEDKSLYQPRGDDPFAKPPAYAENYTRLEGDVRGLSDEQIAERQAAHRADAGTDGSDWGDAPAESAAVEADDSLEAYAPPETPVAPGQGLPPVPEEAIAGKIPTRIEVTSASSVGFRGESIEVEGRLVDDAGAGLGGQRVDVFFAPAGAHGEGARLVGRAVTDAGGRFTARVAIPTDLPLAEHEVFASHPGDDEYQPSLSD